MAALVLSGHHFNQIALLVFSFLGLAKSCTDHHLYEVSGKRDIPGFERICEVLTSMVYYFFHLVTRTLTYRVAQNLGTQMLSKCCVVGDTVEPCY